MADLSKLSVSRKADRMKMAEALASAVTAAGATASIEDRAKRVYADGSSNPQSREVLVHITAPGGAYISIEFDGDSRQNREGVFVDTWQGPRDAKRWLNPSLGDVNPHHWSKLNRVFYGMDNMIARLTRDIARFADGSGYMDETHEKIIAMRARYRANGWDWYGEPA